MFYNGLIRVELHLKNGKRKMTDHENNLLRWIKFASGSERTTYIQTVSLQDLKRNKNHLQLKQLAYTDFTGYLTESDCLPRENIQQVSFTSFGLVT